MGSGLSDELAELARAVDDEFARNRRRHRKRMHCGDGCTDCCHQIFSISELEATAIGQVVAELDEAARTRLRQRAETYDRARAEVFAQHGYIEARGNLLPEPVRLACPALIEGKCAIYPVRPLLCRKYGMPVAQPDLGGRVFACERNFRPGESIGDGALVSIQAALADRTKALQERYRRSGGRRSALPITVAAAITGTWGETGATDVGIR